MRWYLWIQDFYITRMSVSLGVWGILTGTCDLATQVPVSGGDKRDRTADLLNAIDSERKTQQYSM